MNFHDKYRFIIFVLLFIEVIHCGTSQTIIQCRKVPGETVRGVGIPQNLLDMCRRYCKMKDKSSNTGSKNRENVSFVLYL